MPSTVQASGDTAVNKETWGMDLSSSIESSSFFNSGGGEIDNKMIIKQDNFRIQ